MWAYFYPRPPRGGRLAAALQAKVEQLFLSTPSARRATPEYQLPGCAERISIHALREEGDVLPSSSHRPSMYFYPRPPRGGRRRGFLLPARLPPISIHALREEGDADLALFTTHDGVFLSTPSARRATVSFPASCRDRKNFYPRPPRGGRPGQIIHTVDVADISIHALREEGDLGAVHGVPCDIVFLSTPSARRATSGRTPEHHDASNFYPRPPRGGRLRQAFQVQKYYEISIHALREEGDLLQTPFIQNIF